MNSRETWLAERRLGIGGSDIAALLGLSPYKTPMQLWLDKTGRAENTEPDDAQRERMHFGNVLEDVVASEYAERKSATVQRVSHMMRLPDSVLLANIDRAVVLPGRRARWDDKEQRLVGAERVLECKTAHALALRGAEWGESGTDEVPQHYWLQVQVYLGVTGHAFGDLACLFGGQHLRIYTIAADADLFADLRAEAERWWRDHIVADIPPQPRTEQDARSLWRSHIAGREKIVDVTVAEAVDHLAAVKARIAELEEEEQRLRDAVTCAIGDAESISYMGRKLATWRANKASRKTDWRALVEELEPVPEQVAAYTHEVPGARVLRLSTTKEQS